MRHTLHSYATVCSCGRRRSEIGPVFVLVTSALREPSEMSHVLVLFSHDSITSASPTGCTQKTLSFLKFIQYVLTKKVLELNGSLTSQYCWIHEISSQKPFTSILQSSNLKCFQSVLTLCNQSASLFDKSWK